MSEDKPVRKPLRVRASSRRTLDQRLMLRFPALARALSRATLRLPPASAVRQAALWRANRVAAEAYNRRDLEAVTIGFHPDFEYRPARNVVEAGLVDASYRGPRGYRQYVAATTEDWGELTRLEPIELIDLRECSVMLATAPMRALGSGVPLTLNFALVTWYEDGMPIRMEEYHDHDEALAAAGVR